MVGKNNTMNTDPKTWEFPVLGGLISKGTAFNIVALRSLTADEQKKNEAYSQIAANARNRFKLFTILKGNYEQWWSYTRSLLVPAENLDDDEMVELDRLLLNFQSAAKSVIDQFRQEWIQQFRGKSQESQKGEEGGKAGKGSSRSSSSSNNNRGIVGQRCYYRNKKAWTYCQKDDTSN